MKGEPIHLTKDQLEQLLIDTYGREGLRMTQEQGRAEFADLEDSPYSAVETMMLQQRVGAAIWRAEMDEEGWPE